MSDLDWKEGDVRIRRADRYCYVTQKLARVDVFAGGGLKRGPGKRTGATRLVWQDRGFFSHLKDAATRLYALKIAAKDLIGEAGEGENAREILASVKRLEARIHVLVAEAELPAKGELREVSR